MILRVKDFCDYVNRDLTGFIHELGNISRSVSEQEIYAWRHSFPAVSAMLTLAMQSKPQLGN